MNESLVFGSLFMAIGLFSIIGALANWDYLIHHIKTKLLLKLIGRTGARIFYVVLGLALFLIGLLSITEIININN